MFVGSEWSHGGAVLPADEQAERAAWLHIMIEVLGMAGDEGWRVALGALTHAAMHRSTRGWQDSEHEGLKWQSTNGEK